MEIVFMMAAIVFFTRYFFLEPKLPFKLSGDFQRFLGYASFAILPSIAAPILFTENGNLVDRLDHPFIIAGLFAVILSWRTKNVLLSVGTSMLIMVGLQHLI